MEQVFCNSPSKGAIWNDVNALTSPPTHRTPVRQNDRRLLKNTHHTSIGGFAVLPTHITPPSGLTKFIARNPFDADLTSRLHLSVISPTVFSKVSPKMSCDSPGFSWSVDELALIQPAKIEEFPVQQMHCSDPDLEKVAQAAIEKFFNENQIIPSPWDNKRKVSAAKLEMSTPSRPLEELNMTRESYKAKKDGWSQTVLTLPPELPKEVEEALKPYFTFNQAQIFFNARVVKTVLTLPPELPKEVEEALKPYFTFNQAQRFFNARVVKTVLTLPPELPKEVEEALKPYFTFNQAQIFFNARVVKTVLTLPPELPKEVEEALKPYFTFNQAQIFFNARVVKTVLTLPPELPKEVEEALKPYFTFNQAQIFFNARVVKTVLTLPLELPKEVEEALKPYFTFNQDQNVDAEDANSSTNSTTSLRRKLFFNHDNCTDDEDEASLPMSPVRSHGSMIHASSPPHSGMLVHGTPLTTRSFRMERTHGTPYAGNVSPPDMSPICTSGNEMSCQSIKSRCQLAARLDFTTDMSIDGSVRDDKDLRPLEEAELDTNTSMLRSAVATDCPALASDDEQQPTDECPAQNETTEMLSQQTTPLKHEERKKLKICTNTNKDILDRLRIAADWCKNHSDESYAPENNTLLGHSGSGQQSTFNSAQDTGYQTYSMSNITGNTDNCSMTPTKQSLQNWNERMLSTVDEVQLSDWKDNMKNMFSSTPSKYSRRRDDQ